MVPAGVDPVLLQPPQGLLHMSSIIVVVHDVCMKDICAHSGQMSFPLTSYQLQASVYDSGYNGNGNNCNSVQLVYTSQMCMQVVSHLRHIGTFRYLFENRCLCFSLSLPGLCYWCGQ